MKNSLWWILIAIVVIAAVGLYLAYSSTITGNVAKSETKTIFEGQPEQIELNGITYTISDLTVSKTEWASFIITNDLTGASMAISGAQTDTISATEIGPVDVFISSVLYGPIRDGESSARVVLYKKN